MKGGLEKTNSTNFRSKKLSEKNANECFYLHSPAEVDQRRITTNHVLRADCSLFNTVNLQTHAQQLSVSYVTSAAACNTNT